MAHLIGGNNGANDNELAATIVKETSFRCR